ncbi:hypothetical protein ACFQWH_09370 [Mycolicibacterium sp. GCM10028919]|uniref:hypothetical protein n=1 Tax=Mycolicibacterium sp. GCM10028919 TaxID=3273401 RepID=UPI00362242D1
MNSGATFDDDLFRLLSAVVSAGDVVYTLGWARPNFVESVGRDGIWVSTERASGERSDLLFVPAWAVINGCKALRDDRQLDQRDLLKRFGVSQSGFVCALLARFPGVDSVTSPRVGLRLSDPTNRTDEASTPPSSGSERRDVSDTPHEHAVAETERSEPAASSRVAAGGGESAPVDRELFEPSDGLMSRGARFSVELYERINLVIEPGDEIATLSSLKLNEIVAIDRDGIDVATERSRRLGKGPQRVPAWMVTRAWEHLRAHGSLSQQGLLDDLGVKRSAFVCALLAAFPDVEVESLRPTVLRFAPVFGASPGS